MMSFSTSNDTGHLIGRYAPKRAAIRRHLAVLGILVFLLGATILHVPRHSGGGSGNGQPWGFPVESEIDVVVGEYTVRVKGSPGVYVASFPIPPGEQAGPERPVDGARVYAALNLEETRTGTVDCIRIVPGPDTPVSHVALAEGDSAVVLVFFVTPAGDLGVRVH